MNPSSSFLRFSKIVLVSVFLVILAGSVVRMTQSGMGCPDWPKCFGKWVPPTDASQLPADYEKYLKQQDIDHTFNVIHTWTEYINRLFGALLGLLLLIQFFWSLRYWKTKRLVVACSFALLVLTGFQAWLGKRVVDANLAVVKITTHMVVALLIAALAIAIIHLVSGRSKIQNKTLRNLTFFTLLLLTVQIILGTQVREQIDEISKSLAYGGRDQWISKLDFIFYIHRSFSLLIAALCVYVYLQYKKSGVSTTGNKLVLACVVAEIAIGIILAYAGMPAFAQPLHLLVSSVLFAALFDNWLKAA